jgi:hypothetical protein
MSIARPSAECLPAKNSIPNSLVSLQVGLMLKWNDLLQAGIQYKNEGELHPDMTQFHEEGYSSTNCFAMWCAKKTSTPVTLHKSRTNRE